MEQPRKQNSNDCTDTSTPKAGRELRNHLIKGTTGSFLSQMGFAGLSFLNAMLLARFLGAQGYGAFTNGMAWVSLLVIPATLGFGTLLVREVAIFRSQANWCALKGILRFADTIVLILSFLLSCGLAVVAQFIFAGPDKTVMRHTLWVAAFLLPLFAFSQLRNATLRGLEHVVRSRLPGMILRPGLLLSGILLIWLFAQAKLNAPTAMAVNVAATVCTLAVSSVWTKRFLPSEIKYSEPKISPVPWLRSALPMLIYSNMQILLGQTDVVMLGAIRGAADTGIYAAASRLAYLLAFVTVAGETALAPVMARLHASEGQGQLQRILTRFVRMSFFLVLPFGIGTILVRSWILSIFGPDFSAAESALVILVVGRLVDVALGSGALMLSMTGYERMVAGVFAAAAMVNLALNALLIPRYGVEGAAVASTISLVAAKFALSRYAAIKAGLHVTVLGPGE